MYVRLNIHEEVLGYRSQVECVSEPMFKCFFFILGTFVFSHYGQVYKTQKVCISGPIFIGLRATTANTPTATIPEDVSHRRGRNVKGKES